MACGIFSASSLATVVFPTPNGRLTNTIILSPRRRVDGLEYVTCQVWGAGRGHYVRAADQGPRQGEQLLGDLDAILGGVFRREGGQLLAHAFRDVYAGDLVVEELCLPGAAEGHEAEQDADSVVADTLERVLECSDLEDGLRPEGVGPGPDFAPQLLYLPIQVLGRRVEGSPDEEARRLAYGITRQILSPVHPGEDVDEADRVGVEDRSRLGVVPDLGRISRHGQDVIYSQGRRPEQVGLQPDDVPVAAGDVGDDLDAGLVLYDPGRRYGVHPEPGPRP